MHQALLIDEILENVLDSCSDGSSLSRIARTCQAWKEPALDRLWKRLTCVIPLLNLIPGLTQINGVYALDSTASLDLRVFVSYASRVKYIVQRRKIQLDPTVTSLLATQTRAQGQSLFSRLLMVQLSLVNCPTLCAALTRTTKLRSADLDIGFKSVSSESSNRAASDFLLNVRQSAPDFMSLSIRGFASEQLLSAVSSLSTLKTLSLRLGHTMTIDTLIAISKFPFLTELELQAVGIDVQGMQQNWVPHTDLDGFPGLTTLNIHGTVDFIDAFIRKTRSKHLHELRLDIETSAQSGNDNTWDALFNAINEKFSNTLHDLTIEYHIENANLPIDRDDTHNATNNTPSIPPLDEKFQDFLSFDMLHPLSKMHNIRRIMFDTSPPLAVRDQDFDRLVKWWPNLEHLQLGSLPTLDPTWTSKSTVKSLLTISQGLRSLQSLVLPIDSSGITTKVIDDFPVKTHSPLYRVSVTSSVTEQDILTVALNRLFSALEEIEIHTESS